MSVIQYIAHLNLFKFLQINYLNRIVSGMWESTTDIGGGIFDLATSYDLTFTNKLRYKEDNEHRKRFYRQTFAEEQPQPHIMTFEVWKKSLTLRYSIEAFLFFAVMILFQYEISRFNKDLHISIDEYNQFRQIEEEIERRGGITYVETHSSGYHENLDHSSDLLQQDSLEAELSATVS